MKALIDRAERIGAAARRRRIISLKQQIDEAIDQADVTVSGDRLVLAGRVVRSRWLMDPRLRFVTRLGK